MKRIFLIHSFFISFFCVSQNADLRILKTLNQGNMPLWDKTMRGVSFSVYPVMPCVTGGVWMHGYYTKDENLMRNGYKSAIAITFAVATSTGLKYLVNRTRPFKEYPNDIIQRDMEVGPFSFPSGHTTCAFASATTLSLSYKKWYVTVPSYLYAGFVGYSRMRLGVHYPTDVLGGMVIGIGAGLLTWQLDKAIFGK
jgi:undecaprenyl-diphosphatase